MKKQNQQEYLKKLLNKHQKTKQLSESFVMKASRQYQGDIKSGRYNIKEGQKIVKKSKHLSKAEIQNMKDLKRNLQQNLNILDSRVGELTEPEQKPKAIDETNRRKFVTQMSKVRRSLQKTRQKQMQEREQKYKMLYEKQMLEIKKKEQEEKQKRKQQIMKRAQSMQIQKKQRQTQIEQQNKILKAKMHQKIYSQRILQRYRDHQAKDLEEHKRKLAQIRTLHKPLTKSQFQQHLQKIEKLKTSRQKQSKSKILTPQTTQFYKSSWYQKVKQIPKQFQDEKHQNELQHIKQMKDKLKKYAEYVKHNFKPDIDRKKAKSLAQKNKSVPLPKTEDMRQLGLKYLQYSKQHTDPTRKQRNNEEEQVRKIIKPINYLEELKRNHEDKGTLNPKQYVESIKQRKNLSESQKAQKILDYIDSIQRKAKMKEEKGKVNKDIVNQQLDNLYMQAIAMKLSMLGKQS